MNNISITGRIGKEPESKVTGNGKQFATFTVAVNQRMKNKEGKYDTDWFDVKAWGNQAEYVTNYLEKGRTVAVTGRMESRKHEGKTYWAITAESVEALDRPKDVQGTVNYNGVKKTVKEGGEDDSFWDE